MTYTHICIIGISFSITYQYSTCIDPNDKTQREMTNSFFIIILKSIYIKSEELFKHTY